MNSQRSAIAFLMTHDSMVPENMKSIIQKLHEHSGQMENIVKTIKEAESAIEKLKVKFEQGVGSIEALVSVASELLPSDKIDEWSTKYQEEPK